MNSVISHQPVVPHDIEFTLRRDLKIRALYTTSRRSAPIYFLGGKEAERNALTSH